MTKLFCLNRQACFFVQVVVLKVAFSGKVTVYLKQHIVKSLKFLQINCYKTEILNFLTCTVLLRFGSLASYVRSCSSNYED